MLVTTENFKALEGKVYDFIQLGRELEFSLVREVAKFQSVANIPYGKLCSALGRHPEEWEGWEDVVFLPVSAFKGSLPVISYIPGKEFEKRWFSSATTTGNPSVTYLYNTRLYDAVIEKDSSEVLGGWSVGRGLVPGVKAYGLIPNSEDWPHSSLAYMCEYLFGPNSSVKVDESQDSVTPSFSFDVKQIASDLYESKEAQGQLLYGTTYALAMFLYELESTNLKLDIPNLYLFHTGGFKGKTREITPEEFQLLAMNQLGVSPNRILLEYGMSEMGGQFWTTSDRDCYEVPNNLRVSQDTRGCLQVIDVSQLSSCAFLQTDDVVELKEGTLKLKGRYKESDLKGCSYSAEQSLG